MALAVLKGTESDRYDDIPEEVAWLSAQLGVPVTDVRGAHAGYWQYPDQWAEILRPILRSMS